MSVLVAIPVFRVDCKVGIDRVRSWSVVDELILWAILREGKSIDALVEASSLPAQVVVASIARMMRFRLVEVVIEENAIAFRASAFGFQAISSGQPLPLYPKRMARYASFVIEWASGDFFHKRSVRLASLSQLEQSASTGAEVRQVFVEGGGPSMSHQANLNRLSDLIAKRPDDQVAFVDGATATLRDDEYMVLTVIDGVAHGLPETAGDNLRRIVDEVAALPKGTTRAPVVYAGSSDAFDTAPIAHACTFDPADLVVGGSAQLRCLEQLLARAHRRVVVHSTFLDVERFKALAPQIRSACARGVTFDLLWGAEKDEDTEQRNALQATQINAFVAAEPELRGRIKMHMRSTGSHAKLLLVDTAEGDWIATVGSCNWLSSPFGAVELTAVLRDQHLVAEVMVVLQNLVGRRGLAEGLATEMAITARDLRRNLPGVGDAKVSLLVDDGHPQVIREASGLARHRFIVGSNRLGSTARPGAIIQGETAASREGVAAVVMFTQTTGPLKNADVSTLRTQARENGVTLVRTKKIPLHGKFLAWDDDDLAVTSLNWASASADADFPWGDVGVHIRSAGIAASAIEQLKEIFPDLATALGQAPIVV